METVVVPASATATITLKLSSEQAEGLANAIDHLTWSDFKCEKELGDLFDALWKARGV